MACQECTVGCRGYTCSARAVREAYMSPDFPLSAIFLQPSFHSQQQAENFLNTSKYFYVLKMATLAFKLYTYMPTALCSKSTTSCRKPASKPISIFDKLYRINQSSTELSMLQSAVANDCGSDDLGIRFKAVLRK